MPEAKLVHFFEAEDQPIGWSEVWFVTASDLVDAQTKSAAIATERSKILSGGFRITFSRASMNAQPGTVGVRRQRFASLGRIFIEGSYPGSLPSTADTAWQAGQCRFSDTSGQIFRVSMFRGLPDTFWDLGNDKVGAAAFTQWLAGFVPILVANSAIIMHVVRGNPLRTPVAISKGQFERIAKRSSGRPSFLFRGRRAKR